MKSAMMIKETGSHYTSIGLSQYMAKKLLEQVNLEKGELLSVLDPSCGSGELLKAISNEASSLENLQIVGMDTDKEAIDQASMYLNEDTNKNIHLFNGDYLDLFNNNVDLFSNSVKKDDFWHSSSEKDELKKVDMIIANPPYVRTQVLGGEKAQDLGNRFNLKGRVDLYHVFLVAMTQHLKDNGLICVITSNRYLTTAGGKDIRKFLDENYEIIEVIDLGDTKLFEAAVLPAIFIGRKKPKSNTEKNDKVKFFRIYEEAKIKEANKCNSIFEILSKEASGYFECEGKRYEATAGYLKIPEDPKELWIMASKEDIQWSEKVKAKAKFTFEDVFNVRVGIKTTADSVFIRNDWDDLGDDLKPEKELLRPLVSSDTTGKWTLPSDVEKLKILYTHEVKNGKRQAIDLEYYPKAKAYLQTHRERLEGRTYVIKAKRNWYEIWVPQDPSSWASPKLVFPDISVEPKFSLDTKGYLVDGNCYWISLKDEEQKDLLYLALVVANSKFMSKFHGIEFQNKLYSGRKRYLTQYVKNYPIPDPNSFHSKQLIQLGKKLCSNILSDEERERYENEIESEVKKAFGF